MGTNNDVKGLRVVTVLKSVLLKKITENREKHEREFKEAYEGWVVERKKCVKSELARAKKCMKDASQGSFFIQLPVAPVDHLKDYDRVISMLTMSISTELELPIEEFSRYALDEWDWTKEFQTASSNYTNKK